MRFLVSGLFLALALVACGGGSDAGGQPAASDDSVLDTDCAAGYMDELDGLLGDWLDGVQLAASTSRIALSGQVQRLQEMRQDAKGRDVAECAASVHSKLIGGMDLTIDGFLEFMSGDTDTAGSGKINRGVAMFTDASDDLLAVAPE